MMTQIYILIVIIAFLSLFVWLVLIKKEGKREKVSILISLAILCVVLSMMFESRILGYSLIGVGIVLAVVDIILKKKKL